MEETKQDSIIAWLLAAIGFTAISFYLVGPTPSWLPIWLGAAIALSLLLGVLFAFKAKGALRGRFIALFVAALIAARLVGGWLVTQHT